MKWFRLYHEILDDPKVQRLEPALFKFWVNFLCLANRSETRGVVTLDVGEIAFALRIPDADAAAALEVLQRNGLIEAGETGLKPHNWDERQRKSDDVTARVTVHRRGKRAGETFQATDEATDQKRDGNVSPSRATEVEVEEEQEERDPPPFGVPPCRCLRIGPARGRWKSGNSGKADEGQAAPTNRRRVHAERRDGGVGQGRAAPDG